MSTKSYPDLQSQKQHRWIAGQSFPRSAGTNNSFRGRPAKLNFNNMDAKYAKKLLEISTYFLTAVSITSNSFHLNMTAALRDLFFSY